MNDDTLKSVLCTVAMFLGGAVLVCLVSIMGDMSATRRSLERIEKAQGVYAKEEP